MIGNEEESLRLRITQLESRLREVRVGRRLLMGMLEETLREKEQLTERLERRGEKGQGNSLLYLVPRGSGGTTCQRGEKEV